MFMLQTKELPKKQDYAQEVTKNYSDAIAIGLPAEDEVTAKMGIATACAHIVSRRMQSTDNMSLLQSPEIYKMILNLQEAGALERKHGVHELAKTWFQLAYVDLLLDLKAAVIDRDESRQASEQFVRDQLAAFEHIHPTPLPKLMLRYGKYYEAQGKSNVAIECIEDVLQSISRPESRFIPNVQEIRSEAETRLREARSARGTSNSIKPENNEAASAKTGCFLATAAYGSEVAPEVSLLRQYRDNSLLKFSMGRVFVKAYYRISPPLASIIAKSKLLRQLTRILLIGPVLHLVKLKGPIQDGANRK